MQDTPHDTIRSGIAILAAESGDVDWEDGPFPVRGVALPEDIVTNGSNTEGVQTYWPPDTVEAAAEAFEGAKIVDGSEHTAEEVMENPQPSPETIIGELTSVRYQSGVGVLYEGEVDDPEIAKRIDRGRVEVSPTLFRALDGTDEARDAEIASEVKAVRDLSIVAEGAAEGNSIEPAPAAMSALSAEALAAAFDESEGEGTETETGGAESPADQPGGADGAGSDDPTGASPSGSDTNSGDGPGSDPMTDPDYDITDEERRLLEALGDYDMDADAARDVFSDYAEHEEPTIEEQTTVESLREQVDTAKTIYAEALSDRWGTDADKIKENFGLEALREEFEDEDGNISAEALVQEPETGEPDEEPDAAATEEVEALLDEYGYDDREEAVEALQKRYDELSQVGWESQAEDLETDLETLGVEVT